MGTRGIIAKPDGDGWMGRYHHWDSYPSGLGVTLLSVYDSVFDGDVDAMIEYLVDGEPVGWSTINGADWSLPKGWHDRHDPDGPCALCTLPMWRHYAQYYPEGGPDDPMINGSRRSGLIHPDEVMQLGHAHVDVEQPQGPQSYSARGESPEGDHWHRSTDDDASGAEWCYVLCRGGIMVYEGDFGAFGMGGGNFRDPVFVPWGDVNMTAMVAIEEHEDEDA